jgi:amino acid adenylation domain-containing protein
MTEAAAQGERPMVPLHQMFEAVARRTPHAVALRSAQESMTYAELDRRADTLAALLVDRGAGPERLVAIMLERSFDQIIAIIAVLKAGSGYVPIDPAYPDAVRQHVLADSGATIALTAPGGAAGLDMSAVSIVTLDDGWQHVPPERPAPAVPVHPEQVAYVIYTSGSTGAPKGTAVSHRAMHRLFDPLRVADVTADDVVLCFSSISFDASVFEIWAPLTAGAQLALAPTGGRALADLSDFLTTTGVTVAWFTAGVFHALLDEDPEALSGLRQVLAGGDALSPRHVRQALSMPGAPMVINGYGPTEAATFATTHRMTSLPEDLASVPIGSAVNHTSLYVVDERLRPVPDGEVGELCIGGRGVARGYIGRPGLTAQRFVPDPFAADGSVMYRSGDLVVRGADGLLTFHGRTDDQVKVRGFRVELREIEAQLISMPDVLEAAVLAPRDHTGNRRIVACMTARRTLGADDVNSFLQERLPRYCLVAELRVLAALPLNNSGKVDKKALTAALERELQGTPNGEAGAPDAMTGEPASGIRQTVEQVLCRQMRWAVTRDDLNFFGAGMDSISAARVTVSLRRLLHLPIRSSLIFEAATLVEFTAALEALAREGATGAALVTPGLADNGLAFGQSRMWTLDRLMPDSSAYNVSGYCHPPGDPGHGALQAALSRIVARHEALRTVFPVEDAEPYQCVLPAATVELPAIDLSELGAMDAQRDLERLTSQLAQEPFDLATGPLYRFAHVSLPRGRTALIVSFHHICVDGWSVTLFFDELRRLLQGESLGTSPAVQYRDFAAWQRALMDSAEGRRQQDYWRRSLVGVKPVLIRQQDPANEPDGRLSVQVDPALCDALRRLAARRGVTLFNIMLAAWQALYVRRTAQQDVSIAIAVVNRARAEFFDLIGYLGNTLLIRQHVDPQAGFLDLLAHSSRTTREVHDHQDVPYEWVVGNLGPRDRGLDTLNSMFQMIFAFQNTTRNMPPFAGFGLTPLPSEAARAKSELTVSLMDDGRLHGLVEYQGSVLNRAFVEELWNEYVQLLNSVALDPHRPVGRSDNACPPDKGAVMNILDQVERAWLDTLGVDAVEHDVNFFDAGGNSFLLAKLHLRLQRIEPELPITDLFRYPSIETFVASREDGACR